MKKYEYKTFLELVQTDKRDEYLNEMGELGWELVTYQEEGYDSRLNSLWIGGVWKREKQSQKAK